jgi:hypothetical protein
MKIKETKQTKYNPEGEEKTKREKKKRKGGQDNKQE